MCGIAGIIKSGLLQSDLQRLFKMANTLVHRGPDYGGIFLDEKYGLCMSHRRLAIIDTSVAGQHQWYRIVDALLLYLMEKFIISVI